MRLRRRCRCERCADHPGQGSGETWRNRRTSGDGMWIEPHKGTEAGNRTRKADILCALKGERSGGLAHAAAPDGSCFIGRLVRCPSTGFNAPSARCRMLIAAFVSALAHGWPSPLLRAKAAEPCATPSCRGWPGRCWCRRCCGEHRHVQVDPDRRREWLQTDVAAKPSRLMGDVEEPLSVPFDRRRQPVDAAETMLKAPPPPARPRGSWHYPMSRPCLIQC